jgi:hypothetical protein
MKLQRLYVLIAFLLIAALVACNFPERSSEPTKDLAQIVIQTQTAIAVRQFLTATTPPQQDVPSPSSATPTPNPGTSTPTPTQTPSPTATQLPDCKDKADFISETIPDETVLNPGAPFMKTWVLKNAGTCTWTPDYSLVLVQGESMSGSNPLPFGQTVVPGNTIELKLSQIAPSDPGEHAGYWKLHNTKGQDFGNLWVKITVSSGTINGGSDLGIPTWIESFDNGTVPFDLGSDSSTDYEVDNGNLILTAIDAQGDQWRISGKGYPDDFYLEANFQTGSACSGRDSYGLIVRAPDQPDSIIDTGYVFDFSCEGKYRVYRMDNGQFTGLQNWAASSNIKSGPDKANVMGIKAKGNKLELYANGTKIFEFSDAAYSIGYFGLVIRSEVTNNFQVAISQISYWDLSN